MLYYASLNEKSSESMRWRLLAFVVVLAVSNHRTASAQLPARAPAQHAARAILDSFFTVVGQEQRDSAAMFVDTIGFADYVHQQVRNARSAIPMRPPAVEDLMARDSTLSHAVAEWQVEQYRRSMSNNGPFAFINAEFGVATPQELSELPTMQPLGRWIAAKDPRVMQREAARRSGCPGSVIAAIPARISTIRGVAFGDDTTAYAIYTTGQLVSERIIGPPSERLLVLHPRGRSWRIEPRHDLLKPNNVNFGFSCGPR
jgi:hypothetical protein